jgi:hypothetical protein
MKVLNTDPLPPLETDKVVGDNRTVGSLKTSLATAVSLKISQDTDKGLTL